MKTEVMCVVLFTLSIVFLIVAVIMSPSEEITFNKAKTYTLQTGILLLQDSIAYLVLSNDDTVFSEYMPYPDSVTIARRAK